MCVCMYVGFSPICLKSRIPFYRTDDSIMMSQEYILPTKKRKK